MMAGPRLPPLVVLPTTATMTAAAVRDALNATRQSLYNYRRCHGFPAAHYRGRLSDYRTADVAAFLAAHGRTVKWV